ncbi:MAG: arginase/agmatinase/formiminoglutamase [Burkholderiaceae bacterium]|nr:arginase/agmatinase/formiminoglutamase [Burkholderiaceae bacterium]
MVHKGDFSLIVFQGRTADRNARGMAGAAMMGEALGQRLGMRADIIGQSQAPQRGNWRPELNAALPDLRVLAQACEQVHAAHRKPLIAMGRCASALATLPVLARHRPDALLVWFDAHGDANTPATSATGYLGGMVLTAAAGLWDSGLGDGLPLANVVLAGVRDLDPAERELIDRGLLRSVPPGITMPSELAAAIGNRPVYVHIDCDVLEPGIVPTEYRVSGGLTLDDLNACCKVLAQNEIVGIEIAEFEAVWPETGEAAVPEGLIAALAPLLDAR